MKYISLLGNIDFLNLIL